MIKIILLVALIKLLIATDRPILCAGLYTFLGFALGMTEEAISGQAPRQARDDSVDLRSFAQI